MKETMNNLLGIRTSALFIVILSLAILPILFAPKTSCATSFSDYITGGSSDYCLDTSSLSSSYQKLVVLVDNETTTWKKTGITANAQYPLSIKVAGEMNLCDDNKDIRIFPLKNQVYDTFSDATKIQVLTGDILSFSSYPYNSAITDVAFDPAIFGQSAGTLAQWSAIYPFDTNRISTAEVQGGQWQEVVHHPEGGFWAVPPGRIYCGYIPTSASGYGGCWKIYGQGVAISVGGTVIKSDKLPFSILPSTLTTRLFNTPVSQYLSDLAALPDNIKTAGFYENHTLGQNPSNLDVTRDTAFYQIGSPASGTLSFTVPFDQIATPPFGQPIKNFGYGSYKFNVKRVGCRAKDGVPLDSSSDVGKVEYIITSGDPNTLNLAKTGIVENGLLNIQESPMQGDVWIRVIGAKTPQISKQSYSVTVISQSYLYNVSNIISGLIDPIKKKVMRAAAILYNSAVTSTGFISMVRTMLTLYIIFYATGFLMGFVRITQQDLVIRLVKFGLILTLISPLSWKFFTQYFFDFFYDGMDDIINKVTGVSGGVYYDTDGTAHSIQTNRFAFMDKVLGGFYSSQTWLRMVSLLVAFPIGWVFFIMILACMILYTLTLLEAVIAYMIAIIFIPVMFVLFPLVFILILFDHTREYFQNYLKYLVAFFIQPIMLFAALAVINQFVFLYFEQALSFDVCWKKVFTFYIDLSVLLDLPSSSLTKVDLFDIYWFAPSNWNSDDAGLGQWFYFFFTTILSFLIIIEFMKKVTEFIPEVAEMLTGAYGRNREGRSLALSGKGGAGAVMEDAKKPGKMAIGAISKAKGAGGKKGSGSSGAGEEEPKPAARPAAPVSGPPGQK